MKAALHAIPLLLASTFEQNLSAPNHTLQGLGLALRGSPNDWYAFPFIAAVVVLVLAASRWRFFTQWLRGVRGKDWPTVSATIDIVSVVEQIHNTGRGEFKDYLATLTYFYRNPELQSGDYSRLFHSQDDAQAWASSYNGSTVVIHVDPHDPSSSVLQKGAL